VTFTFYLTPEGISRAKNHKSFSYIKTDLQNSRSRGKKEKKEGIRGQEEI
jgi:hypothetical protein